MKYRILTNRSQMEEIILKCQVCHLSMVDQEGLPYVLPFNFGYEDGVIYFHSAEKGRKIAILHNNPNVCVEFSTDYFLRSQNQAVACSYTMNYRSVLVYGKVEFIDDQEERKKVMGIIMRNYVAGDFKYNPPSIREVSCWKVRIEKLEGKVNGY